MQVIGLCRFSYPALGGFQITHESVAEREAFLYAPDRMAERFAHFETLTLPSIRAQTDPDFTFLIVVGESLPEVHLERLLDLVEDVPQAIIRAEPPGKHRSVMAKAINAVRSFGNRRCIQFRLDDDDAVAVDFVSRLRTTAKDARPIILKHGICAIDFNRGYLARLGPAGIHATQTSLPYLTAGLGIVFRPDDKRSVMNFGHHKLASVMPTLTFTDSDMLLRSHHDSNDSRNKQPTRELDMPLLDGQEEAHLLERFNVSGDQVRKVFSDL